MDDIVLKEDIDDNLMSHVTDVGVEMVGRVAWHQLTKRGNYHIRAYLSSSNMMTWTPYKDIAYSYQMTLTRLIRGL